MKTGWIEFTEVHCPYSFRSCLMALPIGFVDIQVILGDFFQPKKGDHQNFYFGEYSKVVVGGWFDPVWEAL